jgi:hypothetical protein
VLDFTGTYRLTVYCGTRGVPHQSGLFRPFVRRFWRRLAPQPVYFDRAFDVLWPQ